MSEMRNRSELPISMMRSDHKFKRYCWEPPVTTSLHTNVEPKSSPLGSKKGHIRHAHHRAFSDSKLFGEHRNFSKHHLKQTL